MIVFGEYGLGKELIENMNLKEICDCLWFYPESSLCEIIRFDIIHKKVIIYNGINFNHKINRTLEIGDFINRYGDAMLFCVGKYNVSWRKSGYTWMQCEECDYRDLIRQINNL